MPSTPWLPSRRDIARMGLGLFAVPPLLAACGSSPTEPDHQPRLTARPGVPTIPPVLGRTDLGLNAGRDGFLYVPQGYDPETPAPLLVALHGAGGNTQTWVNYQNRAETWGFVLLAVDSREVTWDMILGYVQPDVEFIDQALAHTFARCRIDPQRLGLVGFSDGATYALALGRANSDLFSHLIAYSPGYLAEIAPTPRKIPIFISHGTTDDILPIGETRNVIAPYLQNYGHAVNYQEFEGGHTVPAEISDAALNWFLPG